MKNDLLRGTEQNALSTATMFHHIKDKDDLWVETHLVLEPIPSKLNSCSFCCQISFQQHQHHVQHINQNVFVNVCVTHTSKPMKHQCSIKKKHKIFLLWGQLFCFPPNKGRLCARIGVRNLLGLSKILGRGYLKGQSTSQQG